MRLRICFGLAVTLLLAGAGGSPNADAAAFRGVFFNPLVKTDQPNFPWLCFYPEYRERVRGDLRELHDVAGINLVDVFVCIAYSLKSPAEAPGDGEPLVAWANLSFLDGVAGFVDDCHEAGLQVELDLVSNMWIPYSVDPEHQISNLGYWPKPSESPWVESGKWYREMIGYVEGHVKHPEAIAFWCMMGNYELGAAEPCLWEREDKPAITSSMEEFVKKVWPVFRAAGKRPKAPPILLPIFSKNDYWKAKSPMARLSGFTNLKKWIVDDLKLPPDYWVMSSYPFCDPGPDGFNYLRAIVEILGKENAARIVSTDFKGPGHEEDMRDCIISTAGHTGPEILEWHLKKCAEYGFAGWWIWAYQDTPSSKSGIRDAAGKWKWDLVRAINNQREDAKARRREEAEDHSTQAE